MKESTNGLPSPAPVSGEGGGIVTSSRVRLARNLKQFSFPGWMKKNDRAQLLDMVRGEVTGLKTMSPSHINETMENFSPLQKQMLVEKHLISREHAAKNAGSGLVVSQDQKLSVMINEEDHLRLQCIHPGFKLMETWEAVDHLDSDLEAKLDYAYSPTLGYLTACPTNVGTGMRASAMLHLPGLVLSDQINQVIKSVNQIGLVVRGLYGEGTEALGNLFQISNQMTLGESEHQILERLQKVVTQIIGHEQNAREKLRQEQGCMLADQMGRSYGIMLYAHSISSKEALNLLSLLRLAVNMEISPQALLDKIDDLFITTQPAHLQEAAGKKLTAEERDIFRADLLRDKLKSMPEPATKSLRV
ncbi:MAG: protein arginine kinase [bacterium]